MRVVMRIGCGNYGEKESGGDGESVVRIWWRLQWECGEDVVGIVIRVAIEIVVENRVQIIVKVCTSVIILETLSISNQFPFQNVGKWNNMH